MKSFMSKISLSGVLLYFISVLTKDIAHKNLDKIYGDSLSNVERKILLKRYYSKLAFLLKEMFLILFFQEKRT